MAKCAAAEQNPVPGEDATQARLKRVIHDTIKTTPLVEKSNPTAAHLLKWSPAVNGLIARIEFDWGYDYLVRLKNVSSEALTVPIGNPIAKGASRFFEVEIRQAQARGSQSPARAASSAFTRSRLEPVRFRRKDIAARNDNRGPRSEIARG